MFRYSSNSGTPEMFQFFMWVRTVLLSNPSAQSAISVLVLESSQVPSGVMSFLKFSMVAAIAESLRSPMNRSEIAMSVALASLAPLAVSANVFRSSAFSTVVAKLRAVIISYSACFLAAERLYPLLTRVLTRSYSRWVSRLMFASVRSERSVSACNVMVSLLHSPVTSLRQRPVTMSSAYG